ncbi:hypothetical protein [Pseudofulvibacter geojedonensis]|uniref:General secretion pathway protein n=1 Tax=Pseudofulvibacter geojedonensis TaxID=1123758 RepID=A0ABW3I295_9FLAO
MKNKQQLIILLISIFIAAVVCYQFAISKTLVLKEQYIHLKQQEILFKNTPKQLTLVKKKQQYYDSILTKYQLSGNSIQNSLLKNITAYAKSNQLKVLDFVEPHVSSNNQVTIKTYQFTLEGDYNQILALIHKLEQETKFGEIINFHFKKEKNYRTGKHYLQAKVLLKSFN